MFGKGGILSKSSSVPVSRESSVHREVIAPINKEAYDTGILAIDTGSPIAAMLKTMALESVSDEERPEIACMLLEVEAFEKHEC